MRKIKELVGPRPSELQYNTYRDVAERILIEEEQDRPYRIRKTKGENYESGLIKFVQTICDVEEMRWKYPFECEIPYNSSKKFSVSVRKIGHYKIERI